MLLEFKLEEGPPEIIVPLTDFLNVPAITFPASFFFPVAPLPPLAD
jgi:hypothetical protein